jgi:hypothetical protein
MRRTIGNTALLTIDGEKDEICAACQALAAQGLCSNLHSNTKTHHAQAGIGRYGVLNGRRWEDEINPLVRGVIHMSSRCTCSGSAASARPSGSGAPTVPFDGESRMCLRTVQARILRTARLKC